MLRKICFLCFFALSSCAIFQTKLPEPKVEFRGVWIATVVNIDWPVNGTDNWEKQKTDFLRILNFYQQLHFNAVIVQIRTAGDAFYPSDFAPWSRFLTGAEGTAPKTNEDPLHWMIKQAHEHGFEFHAWLNPYRATFDLNTEILAETHDYHQHPDWMLKYGKKYYYNPGLPEVRKHLLKIMDEVVTGYDIDAIHFDDYFYPYKIKNEVFRDSLAYDTYRLPNQSLSDWRRSNVDSLIKNVQITIKEKKPWVQFGVSPFGVWKNKSTDPRGSDTQAGQTTFEDLYADPLLWMQHKWIDYLIPQVYWSMDFPVASHRKIVDWWVSENLNSNLYIGNGAYKIRNNKDKAWNRRKEILKQLSLARRSDEVKGNAFFSAKSLLSKNQDISQMLKRKVYATEAIPPGLADATNKPDKIPELLDLVREQNFYQLSFNLNSEDPPSYALIYAARKSDKLKDPQMGQLVAKIFLNGRTNFNLGKNLVGKKKYLAVTFLNSYRRETKPIVINLNQTEPYDTEK